MPFNLRSIIAKSENSKAETERFLPVKCYLLWCYFGFSNFAFQVARKKNRYRINYWPHCHPYWDIFTIAILNLGKGH
ncbi:hypothetical protein O181_053775 [Austropuccinia psidii MF-1]|uniref:Uncharacterized protein n=1 Tax=Austropuccinia psidii MF-1 TaxID=1389203 RepID=A0A9Q3HTS9_9BASI|nr:hypothetical protein [Austropuccinia psidii MF-1]